MGKTLEDSFNQFEKILIEANKVNKLVEKAFMSDHIGMCTLSLEGKFELVNDACCDIWERTKEELTSLTFQEITHPDDLTNDNGNVHLLLGGQIEHYSMAKRYIMPDGSYKACWLEVSAIKDSEGVFHLFFSKILSVDAVENIYNELLKLKNNGLN